MLPPRIDLAQAARLLGTPPATLERWIRQGLLRGQAGPGGVTFTRAELEAWARRRGLQLAERDVVAEVPEPDLLADAIARGAYTRAERVATARDAVELAVGALTGLDGAKRASLLERVLDRERMASTGLGMGVAVPHPRTPPGDLIARATVSLLVLAEPVDWAAIDGRPVHAVFLLLSPGAPEHLELLSRVARVLRDGGFSEFLAGAPTREDVIATLRSIRREG